MDAFNHFLAAVAPVALSILGTVLATLLARAASVASARWGIEIEARHREALHSALMSGVAAALTRGLSGRAAIRFGIEHAAGSVPDALKKLAPKEEVLWNIAESKLREAMLDAPLIGVDMAGPTTGVRQ